MNIRSFLSGMKVHQEAVDSEHPGVGRIQRGEASKSTLGVTKDRKGGIREIENTLQRKVDGKQLRSVYRREQRRVV